MHLRLGESAESAAPSNKKGRLGWCCAGKSFISGTKHSGFNTLAVKAKIANNPHPVSTYRRRQMRKCRVPDRNVFAVSSESFRGLRSKKAIQVGKD